MSVAETKRCGRWVRQAVFLRRLGHGLALTSRFLQCALFKKSAGNWAALALLFTSGTSGLAQVSPAEIVNSQLKAAEQTYLPQLEALNRAIGTAHFPFTFHLGRYVGLDPKRQAETDTRGIEFVRFHDRVVLKITGNYNAAYNAESLTDNQRASRTFEDVIVPILHLVIKTIPSDVVCDAVGFEVSYHARTRNKSYDYEGREILVVVLDKPDAFGFFDSVRDSERQDILNYSEIFLNGKGYGLQLGQRDAVDVEALGRPASRPFASSMASSPARASGSDARLPNLKNETPAGFQLPLAQASAASRLTADPSSEPKSPPVPVEAPTQAADKLQAQYQSQLDELAKVGAAQFHFLDYAPPSFALFRNEIVLQMTLRNTLHFEKDAGSIYKRAAQTFDLFLAPEFKGILEKIPARSGFDGLDISVINELASKPSPASEAIEFICPLKPLLQFADAEITNQDLINQSIVLVNGVRIALNLAQVE